MNSDIVIVRDGDRYRLVYGHLHLVSELSRAGEVFVDLEDNETIKIVRSHCGFLVDSASQRLPLLMN